MEPRLRSDSEDVGHKERNRLRNRVMPLPIRRNACRIMEKHSLCWTDMALKLQRNFHAEIVKPERWKSITDVMAFVKAMPSDVRMGV